ncbi:ATP synthase F1 subunit gamma [Ktedonosporobacter rubrisoli]|uniref:ATP synthase gamma chain n=1 Tax=Ktedonosporobacter rubrisoli TaxID=2509675 RepID=A0A4P6JWB3_KTERU|nr:ATP synthase F1 subunit gamma [Ktedonosporobacter rubrisoli]QBD79755.1 ATP synthase F1 subunit gamma [Ktedonosporobacter rubrisoli]
MPSTREIRRRMRAVKNLGQVTKSMQMVASSKMRRAQDRVAESRPYADQLRALVSRLANASGEDFGDEAALLKQRSVRKIGLLLIAPDRGMCGALPSNVNRKAASGVLELQNKLADGGQKPGVDYIAVGRRGRDFIVRSQQNLIAEFTNYGDRPALTDASAIAQVAVDAFLKEEVDVVYLVYPEFVNTVIQRPTLVQLLPVQPPEDQGDQQAQVDYIYEPGPKELLQALLPRYIDVQVYQAMLETIASFYSAQMVAMKNATDNANEVLQDLTLTYNKARQASITTQILEVVSGAEAL